MRECPLRRRPRGGGRRRPSSLRSGLGRAMGGSVPGGVLAPVEGGMMAAAGRAGEHESRRARAARPLPRGRGPPENESEDGRTSARPRPS